MAIYTASLAAPPFPSARTPRYGNGATAPAAFDPSGLVPINRTQPMAGSQAEVQRLAENRLGTMPPSSFSGSGAGFVPVDRGNPIMNPAVVASDTGMQNTQQFGPAIPVSQQARRDLAIQRVFGDGPQPAPDSPLPGMDMVHRVSSYLDRDTTQTRRQALLDRLQSRMPPDAFSALQQRLAANDARRAQMAGQGGPPMTGQARIDYVRQLLANRQPYAGYNAPGLLGTAA